MKIRRIYRRHVINLSLVLIISLIFAVFIISLNFIHMLYRLFETYTSIPIPRLFVNLIFLWLTVLLWLTYRRWREAVMRQKELEDMIDSISPDVFMMVDEDRRIMMCNRSVKDMFGYDIDEVVKQKTDILYSDRRSDTKRWHEIYDVLERAGFHVGLADGKHKNGREVPLEIITGNLMGRHGAVVLLRDISQRRRMETELRRKEETERRSRKQVMALVEVSNELSKADSFDELCRRAIELGRSRLGFDRLGIWFLSDEPNVIAGSFGTDENGRIRDERNRRLPMNVAILKEGIRSHETTTMRRTDVSLLNDRGQAVGKGTLVHAAMWKGEELIGYISADNLLKREPITNRECELLALYASTLAHLCSRKRAEEALRASEANYRAIFGAMNDAILVHDIETGGILDVNARMCEMFGQTPEEARRIDVGALSAGDPPYTQEDALRWIKKAAKEGPQLFEWLAKDKSGRLFWVEVNLKRAVIGGEDRLLAVVRDITKRKHAEEGLRKSEETYRVLYEESPAIKMMVNSDGTIMSVNKSFGRRLGYTEEQIVGSQLLDIVVPGQKGKLKEQLDGALEGREALELDIDVYAKDGTTRTVLLSAGQLELHEEAQLVSVLVTGIDITERKRVEEEKERMHALLIQSQKMEAIGRLAGGIAHDFNNLLTAITGYGGRLLERLPPGDPLRRDAEEINKAGKRAGSLTRQLLSFSRRGIMQPDPLDLNAVVGDMEKLLRRLIGEDIELAVTLTQAPARVKADVGQIEQVVMNLAINARDAMPEGGKLSIKTENVVLKENDCKVMPEARPGRFVCLSVSDTGVGMDETILAQIFEPFFSTKVLANGTGLGLSMVYGIVKQHEGWIDVRSKPGKGSTFVVYLPAHFVAPKDRTEKSASLQELQGNGERVLVVEDEEQARGFAAITLRENGYVVFEAATTDQALEIFEKEHASFALLFSDVILADKTGLYLAGRLVARDPELKVILTSGYAGQRSYVSFIHQRGFRFLAKPYDAADLLRAIKETLTPNSQVQ